MTCHRRFHGLKRSCTSKVPRHMQSLKKGPLKCQANVTDAYWTIHVEVIHYTCIGPAWLEDTTTTFISLDLVSTLICAPAIANKSFRVTVAQFLFSNITVNAFWDLDTLGLLDNAIVTITMVYLDAEARYVTIGIVVSSNTYLNPIDI